ncbi:hypothetical protein SDC9_142718 [bioreactor metagenome]|uniref:Uncharacterized protein n=1 Tax=bioreactor metagenome TaxID=1076179 RepID=A0A645E430_9ZZZZ
MQTGMTRPLFKHAMNWMRLCMIGLAESKNVAGYTKKSRIGHATMVLSHTIGDIQLIIRMAKEGNRNERKIICIANPFSCCFILGGADYRTVAVPGASRTFTTLPLRYDIRLFCSGYCMYPSCVLFA